MAGVAGLPQQHQKLLQFRLADAQQQQQQAIHRQMQHHQGNDQGQHAHQLANMNVAHHQQQHGAALPQLPDHVAVGVLDHATFGEAAVLAAVAAAQRPAMVQLFRMPWSTASCRWRMCGGAKAYITAVLTVGARLGSLQRARDECGGGGGGGGGGGAAGQGVGVDAGAGGLLPFLPKEMWLLILGMVVPSDMCTVKHKCRRNGFKEPFRDLVNAYNVGAARRVNAKIELEY